ncbi:MAG: PhzF family phenazine biosynthesis protein [Oscillospiraceae bacterium]|nr:PhzF family phenazine biosynthesis protein [Oscillospiraceae bacterium]
MFYYVADAFTDRVFGGGPAGVVITDEWLPDALMQKIAMENNLADTAFCVPQDGDYGLRWFMPEGEINLNGHATLAAAWCLFQFHHPERERIVFHSPSGALTVTREGALLALDLPAVRNHPIELTQEMVDALGARPQEAYFGENLFFVFSSAGEVRSLKPDFEKMKRLPMGNGVFVSAPGDGESDIVARTFWPKMGVNEDPVCGNMHCNLTPFWSQRLGKREFISHQLSKRGAVVICEDLGERVKLKGTAALFLKGEVNL